MNADIGFATIRSLVDERGWLDEPADTIPYVEERRGLFTSSPDAVALPTSTRQVADIVRTCAEHGIGVVPQGGNTGLCGGAVALPGAPALLLNLKRMNRILEVDPLNYTLTAEGGSVLADVHTAASTADRYFPLSLGAEGSCQIGGNLATNAGGIGVLRYGNARDLCLGLEVVLADGRVWNGLNTLRKNNTGFDLRDLFIGAEGTLGIITRVVLKLFPRHRDQQTALVALTEPAAAIRLLALARDLSGDSIVSFELMSRLAVGLALKHIAGIRKVFQQTPPWTVLLTLAGGLRAELQQEQMELLLVTALEQNLAIDAAVAVTETQAAAFWRLRDGIVESQKLEGASVKHDVSVPVSSVPEFLQLADKAVAKVLPGVRPCAFGHLGDGNIHYNLTQPVAMTAEAFMARREQLNRIVHDIVFDLGGSFSAEHGVGCLKLGEMERYKSPVELDLMRSIKLALDPAGIMNPGKVIPGRNDTDPG